MRTMRTDRESQKHPEKSVLPPTSEKRATYSLLYTTENTIEGINYSQLIPALAAYVFHLSLPSRHVPPLQYSLYGLHDERSRHFVFGPQRESGSVS